MNKRIRELAERAGAEFEKTNGINDCSQDSLVGDEIEAFAELIIAETIKICEQHPSWSGMSIGNAIKYHFEVAP